MRVIRRLAVRLALAAAALGTAFPLAATATAKPTTLKVMSRNLNLGANLELGVRATSLQGAGERGRDDPPPGG
jgi:hypothetical protein